MELNNEIAQLAYEIYEISGRQEERDLANWLEAERIIVAAHRPPEENLLEGKEETEKKDISRLEPVILLEKQSTVL